MEQYYVQANVNMMPKNKAWKELQDFAYDWNGTLIQGDEHKESFIKSIIKAIEETNIKHPRCTNIAVKRDRMLNIVYAKVGMDLVFSITLFRILKIYG